MYKTGFSDKCAILGTLWVNYREEAEADKDGWAEFFKYADIGLPLAYIISTEIARSGKESVRFIDETWEMFCQLIDINPEDKYASLTDCFNASPNYTRVDDEED